MARRRDDDDMKRIADSLDILLLLLAADIAEAKSEDRRRWLDQALARVKKLSDSYEKKAGFFARMLLGKKKKNEQHSTSTTTDESIKTGTQDGDAPTQAPWLRNLWSKRNKAD